LTVRVQKVKDELQLWLEDDDDLGDLCLSRKIATTSSPVSDSDEQINSYPTSPTIGAKISRAKSHLVRSATVRGDDQNDVEEVEMLLEAHYMQIDRTLNKLAELREYLDDTEDYINFQFEVIITAGSVCISVYSLVVGILSTNIPFSWNTKEHMFKWVVSATATLCAIFFVIIISYARYKKLVGN
jgi:magnesium transporter